MKTMRFVSERAQNREKHDRILGERKKMVVKNHNDVKLHSQSILLTVNHETANVLCTDKLFY